MSVRSRLARLKRNRKRLSDAIKRAPRAPPSLGPLGQAYNVLRRSPEPLIDASQVAFQNRLLLEAAVAQQNRLEMIQNANMDVSRGGIGPAIVESFGAVTPSIDEIEQLVMAATDEELLDEDLVNEIVKEIEMVNTAVQTGRDVIRNSKQFDRQNLLPRFAEKQKRTRKKTKTDKNMSKALRQANERFRTKKGKLRKGATQAQIMKYAHKLLKRM